MRALVLIGLLGSLSNPGWAGKPNDPELDALVWKAQQLAKGGDHAGALETYRDAFARSPRAQFLLDIAREQRKVGQEVESIDTYERYLKHPNADAKQKRWVQLQLGELYSRLGSLRIEVDRPASITVDGKLVGEGMLVATTRAIAGDHGVLAQSPGYRDATAKVTVAAGEEVLVQLRMVPVGEPAPPEPPAAAGLMPIEEPPVMAPEEVQIETVAAPAVLWLQARGEADVRHGEAGPSAGLAVALGRRFEIEALALIQDTTGMRVAATLYLWAERPIRPFARAGVPVFFPEDAVTAGAHVAAGVAWRANPRLSVFADFSVEYYPDPPGGIDRTIPLLSLGVAAGVL